MECNCCECKNYEKGLKSYKVETPVDPNGGILFNDNKQVLFESRGYYCVGVWPRGYTDGREEFEWLPCEYKDLKYGDVFYPADDPNPVSFIVKPHLYLGAENAFTVGKNVCVAVLPEYAHYYKLTRRKQ